MSNMMVTTNLSPWDILIHSRIRFEIAVIVQFSKAIQNFIAVSLDYFGELDSKPIVLENGYSRRLLLISAWWLVRR